MSAGYATKLSYRDDLGGQLGDPELYDTPTQVLQKVTIFREWVSCIWDGSLNAKAFGICLCMQVIAYLLCRWIKAAE